jgi:hypothetical protein
MATISPVSLCLHFMTTPYVPSPIGPIFSYESMPTLSRIDKEDLKFEKEESGYN